jgi:predicted permease
MKNTKELIERTLIVEQRYIGLRSSSQFQSKISKVRAGAKKYFDRMILINYGFTAVMLIIFSLVMISPALFSADPALSIADIGFVLFAYTLSMSIYNSFIFFNTLGTHRLVEPLGALPLKGGDDILFTSWLKYNGSTSIFIVIPVLVVYSVKFFSYETLFIGALWLLSIIILGYSIGAVVYVSVRKRISSSGSPFMSSLKGAIRMVVIIGVFAIFEIMIYFPQSLINHIPRAGGLTGLIVPVLNVSTVVFQGYPVNQNFVADIGISTFYLAIFLVLFTFVKSWVYNALSNSPVLASEKKASKSISRVYGLLPSLFLKDLRGLMRKCQQYSFFQP